MHQYYLMSSRRRGLGVGDGGAAGWVGHFIASVNIGSGNVHVMKSHDVGRYT